MNKKRALVFLFGFALAGVLVLGLAFQNRNSMKLISESKAESEPGKTFDLSTKGLAIGTKLEPVTMVSLRTGEPVELFADYDTQPAKSRHFVVIVFFSTTCPGCAKDLDYWRDLVEACERMDVKVYLATFETDFDKVNHFTDTFEFANLPVLYNGQGRRVAGLFDIDIVPTTYVFRGNGELVAKYLGLRWLKEGKEIAGDEKLKEILTRIGG